MSACLALGSTQARASKASPAQCGPLPSHITLHKELKNAHTSDLPGENIVRSHDEAINLKGKKNSYIKMNNKTSVLFTFFLNSNKVLHNSTVCGYYFCKISHINLF